MLDASEKNFKKDPSTYLDNHGMIYSTRLQGLYDKKGLRGIRDESGKLQAVAHVSETKDAIKVEYLATASHNVKPPNPSYRKGSGTAAMEQILLESIRKGKGGNVVLEALPGAIGFYEKIGFKNKGQAKDFAEGVVNMSISGEDAKKFLTRRGLEFSEDTEFYKELIILEDKAWGAFCGKNVLRRERTSKP